jgi:hypothetical protein
MMLMLHRAALIELPPVRCVIRNPMLERGAPARVSVDEVLGYPLTPDLRQQLSGVPE